MASTTLALDGALALPKVANTDHLGSQLTIKSLEFGKEDQSQDGDSKKVPKRNKEIRASR
ncbi:hypothetical protein DITRI_Ditri03aG0091500 [Diplodiscus trichospermus]